MCAPKRIQRKRTKGWRMPKGSIYVGRPSKWGNPFAAGREQVVVLFPASRYMPPLSGSVWPRDPADAVALYRLGIEGFQGRAAFHSPSIPSIKTIRAELAGKDLACWCTLDAPCHADVLLELANQEDA